MTQSTLVLACFHIKESVINQFISNLQTCLGECNKWIYNDINSSNELQSVALQNVENGSSIPLCIRTRYYTAEVSLLIYVEAKTSQPFASVEQEGLIILLDVSSYMTEQHMLEDLNTFIQPYISSNLPCVRVLAMIDTSLSNTSQLPQKTRNIGNNILEWAVLYHFEILYPLQMHTSTFKLTSLLHSPQDDSYDSSMSSLINCLHCHTWRSMIHHHPNDNYGKKNYNDEETVYTSNPQDSLSCDIPLQKESKKINDRKKKLNNDCQASMENLNTIVTDVNLNTIDQLFTAIQDVRQRSLLPAMRRQDATDALMRIVDILENSGLADV